IRTTNCVFYSAGYMQIRRESGGHFWQKLGRTAESDFRSEFAEQVDGRTRHPAVIDVADDRNLQVLQRLFGSKDRVCVEQRLGWMLVHAVSRVDDRNIEMA